MRRHSRSALVAGCALAVAAGAALGAAAQGDFVNSPVGLSAAEGIDSRPAPIPSYETNALGLTYGSAAHAVSSESEPDLILVETADGATGYVYKADLDDAQGPGDDATPDEVLEWMNSPEARQDREVPVYEVDGTTVIGTFVITGLDESRP